jgi:hypothetical protein
MAASSGVNADPCYSIQTISAFRNFWLSWNSGGSNADLGIDAVANYDTIPTTIVARFTATDRVAVINGRVVRTTGSYSAPTYGSGELWLGLTGGITTEYALIWKRGLSITEMQQLSTVDPWGWKRADVLTRYAYPGLNTTAGGSFSPFTVGFNA